VMRGIATGANEFFFLTTRQAQRLRLPDEFLIPAIGRTRDVSGDEVTAAVIEELVEKGRPTLLFAPDGRPLDAFPQVVRDYLAQGEHMGIDRRTLIRTRRPWYKMESRNAPPFLFAYLGRRNARFIRNLAGIIPLTGFLCIYPRADQAADNEQLWQVLKHPDTAANLRRVGKSYGSGAIKVEPRALERLPIPAHVLAEAGLLKAKRR
jgi:adenine-specific DNA-methyltransferase